MSWLKVFALALPFYVLAVVSVLVNLNAGRLL